MSLYLNIDDLDRVNFDDSFKGGWEAAKGRTVYDLQARVLISTGRLTEAIRNGGGTGLRPRDWEAGFDYPAWMAWRSVAYDLAGLGAFWMGAHK